MASGWDYSKPISTQMFFEHPASKRLLREEEIVSLKMNSLRPWEIDKQLKPHPVDIYADQEKDLERVSRYIDYVTKDRTFMGKVAQGASVLPTWMLEFAMSGGMAKVGSTATKATMLKLLQKHATTKAGQAALRAAGWTGGAITRASIGLAPRVAEKTATRQLEAEAGFRQPENWATSFAKAWGDTVIESASEEAGGAITKGLGAVAGKLPFGSKFVNGLRSAWMKATGGAADDFARKIMTKAGYSNIIGEIGEERLGTVLRALTDVEDFGAGDGANMYQRLRAGLTEDIKNLRVEAAVLSVPMAVQGGMSRLATSPAATQAGARPMVDTPAAAKSATGPTEAPAKTEATGVQGEKKDIVAPEVKPGPSTVAGPPAAPATTETGTTGEPGPTSEPPDIATANTATEVDEAILKLTSARQADLERDRKKPKMISLDDLTAKSYDTDVIKEQIDEITARKIKSHPALKGHAGLYFRDAGSGHAGSGRGQQAVARTAAGQEGREEEAGTADRVGGQSDSTATEKLTTSPDATLATKIAKRLDSDKIISPQELRAMADTAYGKTRAEGGYGISDAYDAMETGVNKYLEGKTNPAGDMEAAKADVQTITAVLKKIPMQKARSGEKDAMQQFSTPPHYAYGVAWVANIGPNDVVLEPEAGTGSLLVQAANANPKAVYGNELSQRRAELLRQFKTKEIFTEDAEQIHNILDIKPTVILMNPPFSRAAQRMGDKKIIGTDRKHIDASLELLAEGGRLVAIMGRPLMENKGESAGFNKWMDGLKKKYNVRANVYVGRDIYKKYGTSFPTRVLVIDKTGPTTGDVLGGTVDTVDDLMYTLQGVRNDRQPITTSQPDDVGAGLQKAPATTRTSTQPRLPVQSATDVVGTGESQDDRPVESRPVRPVGTGQGDVQLEAGQGSPTADRPDQQPGGIETQSATSSSTDDRKPVLLAIPKRQRQVKEISDSIFEPYRPAALTVKGAKPHPGSLAESAAFQPLE